MYERRILGLVLTAAGLFSLLFALGQLPTTGRAAEPEPTAATVPETTEPQTPPTAVPAETESIPIDWAAAEAMDGRHIFVYDCCQKTMLFSKTDARDTLYPASITKLFSAWVALQYLQPEQKIQAGRELGLLQPGSSTAYIAFGSVLTAEMLIEGMLLPSGNDAAYVVAAAAGRVIAGDEKSPADRAVEVFVEEMNRQAEELGLTGTHFENPDGYHADGHYSCPADLAVIGALALENEIISRYVRCRSDSVRFASGETCTWTNTNRLLKPESEYYCPSAIGLKTGYTKQAGYCLLAAFDTETGPLLVGIFGSENKYSRYADAVTLMELAAGEG